jgi:hypothetical protein
MSARKVPSARSNNIVRPVAGAVNILWTPGRSTMFIVTRMAVQWTACFQINSTRPCLSAIVGHVGDNAENPHGNGQRFPETYERLVRHTGISDAKDCEEKHYNERKLFPQKAGLPQARRLDGNLRIRGSLIGTPLLKRTQLRCLLSQTGHFCCDGIVATNSASAW